MLLSQLIGDRFKERPSDCVIESHALMLRGGYMKYVASGIFSLYTPLRRITRKIEQIIREEMDAIDGQEVLFPVALPASLWEESGRFESVGRELLRFKDRNDSQMVLGMTHEEACVQLVREYGNSFAKYPFMLYQIQTKFRDEARPRGGLIRVREFTMKDAYSFHTSQEDLEQYYQRCYDAYNRIFERAGLKNFVTVASDSGIMGGNLSHEYMFLTPVGEDTIVLCKACDYRANMEAAACITHNSPSDNPDALSLAHTPNVKTIEDVCAFLKSEPARSVKAVVYQMNATDEYVVLFLRGDLEVNETKLTNFLGGEIHPAASLENSGLTAGFIGPVALGATCKVLYDRSIDGLDNLICGANRDDHHYTGFSSARDLPDAQFHDFAKIQDNGICPVCGKHEIALSRGIEIGNIFQLGQKYTRAMGMQYQDQEGNLQHPIMGCYGIGVGRMAASICEESRDDYGPIWPMSVAPWQVHLCCMRADQPEAKQTAHALYQQMKDQRIEVTMDDRTVSAGVMFSDADLLGVPIRVIVSPRNLKEGICEIVTRDKSVKLKVPMDDVMDAVKNMIKERLDATC